MISDLLQKIQWLNHTAGDLNNLAMGSASAMWFYKMFWMIWDGDFHGMPMA